MSTNHTLKPGPLLEQINAGNQANAKAQAIELDRLRAVNEAAIEWIRVIGEETILAGYPGGDRDVTLANVRAMRAVNAELRAALDRCIQYLERAFEHSSEYSSPMMEQARAACQSRGEIMTTHKPATPQFTAQELFDAIAADWRVIAYPRLVAALARILHNPEARIGGEIRAETVALLREIGEDV